MSMHLMLIAFLGSRLLFWAVVIGYGLLKRIDGQRHSLTLLDDRHIEL